MAHYDEVEIEDMDWNDELNAFTYSCPCGDLFQITMVRSVKLAPPSSCCGWLDVGLLTAAFPQYEYGNDTKRRQG
jgi:CSL zinc finger